MNTSKEYREMIERELKATLEFWYVLMKITKYNKIWNGVKYNV